jgi:hypothetical protein
VGAILVNVISPIIPIVNGIKVVLERMGVKIDEAAPVLDPGAAAGRGLIRQANEPFVIPPKRPQGPRRRGVAGRNP